MNDIMFTNKDFVFSILENSYDGIYITDKNSVTIYVNKAYENLTGHKRSEYIGKHMDELISSGIMKVHITGDVIRSGNSVTVTEELISGKNVLITGNPIFNDQKEIIAVITNVRDISEIISLEKKERLAKEVISRYQKQFFDASTMKNIICESSNTISVFNFAAKVAPKDSTVLLTGETGVGKEVVAKYIHYNSLRKDNNYIKINCGAIPENLLESELFGYEEGSFTGAVKNGKKGKFEQADKGTLFIDEINQMPVSVQPKILRVLQEREVDRIGSERSIPVDVRIIAASNQDLKKLVGEGKFREDLYYRLNVFPIYVPPLRDRLEDLELLINMKIRTLNIDLGKSISKVDDSVFEAFRRYDWPGNIRELYNKLEQAMNHVSDDEETLRLEHFSARAGEEEIDIEKLKSFDNPIEEIKKEAERKLISEVLEQFDGNKTRTAECLKIPRSLLYQKMKRLGMDI